MRRVCLSVLALALASAPALAEELSRDEWNGLRRRAQAAAAADNQSELASALRGLAQDDSERAAEFIAQVAIQINSGEAYDAAKQGLADMDGEEAVEWMIEQSTRRRTPSALKILLLDAFALRSDAATGAALGGVLQDRDPTVIRVALEAIRTRKPNEAVDGMIDLLEQLQGQRGTEDSAIMDSLLRAMWDVTGESFENAADWRNFWEIRRDNYERPVTGGEAPDRLGSQTRGETPTFFGSELRSNRIVFVIDISGSMEGQRLADCKEQLVGALDALRPGSMFTIVAYSTGFRQWNAEMQPVNPRNIGSAREWVQGLQANGMTETLKAIKAAFEVEGPDTMVLLSDGAPTETDPTTGEQLTTDFILEEVAGINRFKRWTINTFGFGDVGGGLADFMQDLAEQNNGTYTAIH